MSLENGTLYQLLGDPGVQKQILDSYKDRADFRVVPQIRRKMQSDLDGLVLTVEEELRLNYCYDLEDVQGPLLDHVFLLGLRMPSTNKTFFETLTAILWYTTQA